jgi:hypothetical protein
MPSSFSVGGSVVSSSSATMSFQPVASFASSTVAAGCRAVIVDGVPKAMEGADAGIAPPGEDELIRAAHPYHLVVDEVRRHPDQGQVPPPLADDLVRACRRDQMREPLQGDGVAVAHQPGDRLPQLYYLSHAGPLRASLPCPPSAYCKRGERSVSISSLRTIQLSVRPKCSSVLLFLTPFSILAAIPVYVQYRVNVPDIAL